VKKKNYKKGKIGEEIAGEFLRKKGYIVLDQNWKNRYGEIDLVCTNGDCLVFVEVKLKMGEDFGTPEEMISSRKIIQVMRTAESYCLANRRIASKHSKQMVEAVCIVLDQENEVVRLDHYENLTGEL